MALQLSGRACTELPGVVCSSVIWWLLNAHIHISVRFVISAVAH